MTMRVAAIDFGTNSTKMTVADQNGVTLRVIFERSQITRLGKGVDNTRLLDGAAMESTLRAAERFVDEARAAGVSVFLGVGTSALRDAQNATDFIHAVKDRCGVDLEIITGDREATLAFEAVRSDDGLGIEDGRPILVFDIGGGSTEIIIGSSAVEWHRSLHIGAVRLTERYIRTDPPKSEETQAIEQFTESALSVVPQPDRSIVVAGIGGTAVNVAAVIAGSKTKDLHGSAVSTVDVGFAYDRFRRVSLTERREIPGLEPARADVIIAGAAILNVILRHFMAPRFVLSTRGLRYGVIADHFKQSGGSHPDR